MEKVVLDTKANEEEELLGKKCTPPPELTQEAAEKKLIQEQGSQEPTEAKKKTPVLEFFERSEEFEKKCKEIVAKQAEVLDGETYQEFETNADKHWDIYYKRNTTNSYKDRHYISVEFNLPVLIPELKELKGRRLTMLEAGCGVGNALFPLSKLYSTDLKIFGFDFSANAVDMIQKDPRYDTNNIEVHVADLVNTPLEYKQLDIVTLIFVLSAISPENHLKVMQKLWECMDANSYLYFRDYAEFDMAQLRLAKKKSKLKDNFYLKDRRILVWLYRVRLYHRRYSHNK